MERVENSRSGVGDTMHEASDVVSAKTDEAVQRGRNVVTDQARERSSQLADQIGTAAQTMRQVAEQSRTQGNTQQARMAEQAAERSERMSNYLQNVDPEQMLDDVEDFARRRPWVVAGAGLLVGFAVARSLKASSARRYTRRDLPSRYDSNGAPAWSASPGAPRDVTAGMAGNVT